MQVQHVMQLGKPGDLPVAGDWDGDGIDTIGIFRHGRWMLDVNGNGRFDAADLAFAYGEHDDLPITGDWNGDSITDVGVYRHGYWILDTNSDHRLDHGDVQRAFGYETDKPVVIDEHGVGGIHFELYRAIISRNRPI